MIARLAALVLVLLATACSPGIGSSCTTNADCGSDRTCDTSQPGGYCTQASCVRIGCPSDAVCIVYEDQVSYCMQRCGPFAFCREGYTCVEGVTSADGKTTYPGFCNQTASRPDAVTPGDILADTPAGG